MIYLILMLIGTLGYLGIYGKHDQTAKTIFDYYPSNNFVVFTISVFFGINQLCLQPLMVFISRANFFDLFIKNPKDVTIYHKMGFNLTYITFCLVIGEVNFSPDILIK
jgi:hypothetical protein